MLCVLMSNVCSADMCLWIHATSVWVLWMYPMCTRRGVCVRVCVCVSCVLMFVYICVDRESGWLLPAAWQLCTEAWRHHHHSAGPSLRYVPRRAVLYCPGNDERKLRKLASLDVDCAVLDCEDGVALSKKVHKPTDVD